MSSRGRFVNAVGVRGRLLVLPSEGSAGVPDAPPMIAGWCGTVGVERPWFAVEQSAEVVVPAGSLIVGKDRTRSRDAGRVCSWDGR